MLEEIWYLMDKVGMDGTYIEELFIFEREFYFAKLLEKLRLEAESQEKMNHGKA